MTPDECARDTFEERAAIREHDGGQDRETAERAAWPEARHAAGITALDDWRREADDRKVIWLNEWKAAADDVTNPDAWR